MVSETLQARRPVRIAVVGSGPSGLYAAEALAKQDAVATRVDVFDRLPTPYGLVRYGVAPDHPNIKSVIGTLQQVLERESVRFVGGVEFGVDVTRAELLRHYDAVVYALGASLDRPIGIPGEELPGSYPATDFVAWYSGHPDAVQPFPLQGIESVAVIGVGNVALDVARMLAKTPDDLAQTDTPVTVLEALRGSTVREIHIIGRRGPEHAKFTTKELRELGELVNASVLVRASEVVVAADAELSKAARSNIPVLERWATLEPEAKPRQVWVRFWLRPAELQGDGRVQALVCERAALDADGTVVGTGEFETIPVDVVLRAVGYRSHPPRDVSFDARANVIPNAAGRVLDADGHVLPGEYVAGWIKRGPTGVIGTNKSDAAETVRSLVEDLLTSGAATTPPPPDFDAELAARGIVPVDFQGWMRIDAEELSRGAAEGRPRSKVHDWPTLRELASGATASA